MILFQDPTDEQSPYLLESLLDAFQSATYVAGAFAFASSAGVRLLARDEAFQEVAQNHRVDLVVGIDAVTNIKALDSLLAVSQQFPNVQVQAFLNPTPSALFHPKFCWTKSKNGGSLITGSGNLTEGGLLGNWEAYTVEQLTVETVSAVESTWISWKHKHTESLLPLDNPDVRKRASANHILAPEGDLPTLVAPKATPAAKLSEQAANAGTLAGSTQVLIAEIPQSGNRWKQVNFHLDDYENFFGAKEGRLVVFRHVNSDGTLADYEKNRPPVTVKSRNFRFELSAASGLAYPDPQFGRPIGVYIRVATRTYLYRLMLPNDPEYKSVSSLLARKTTASGTRMRSTRMTVADLRTEWTNAPFWNITLEDQS